MSAWYDYKTKEEIVNSRLAHQLLVCYYIEIIPCNGLSSVELRHYVIIE